MAHDYGQRFWTDGAERYHDLAQKYEEGVTMTHPPGAASCWCSENCPFARSTVIRYEYRGESVV